MGVKCGTIDVMILLEAYPVIMISVQVVYLGDNPKSREEKAVTLYNKMSRLQLELCHAEEF